MGKYGGVEDSELFIGRAKYKLVIISPSINIASSTLALLNRFVDAGGTIIAIESTPKFVNGSESPELTKLLSKAKVIESLDELAVLLKNIDLDIVVESDDGNILVHSRAIGDDKAIFIVNVDRWKGYSVRIGVRGRYSIEEWNPFLSEII